MEEWGGNRAARYPEKQSTGIPDADPMSTHWVDIATWSKLGFLLVYMAKSICLVGQSVAYPQAQQPYPRPRSPRPPQISAVAKEALELMFTSLSGMQSQSSSLPVDLASTSFSLSFILLVSYDS